MLPQGNRPGFPEIGWESLYRAGGVSALLAGILFRRNLGVEMTLFSAQKQPENIQGWFSLLQQNRFLGLAYLNVFDIANYLLVGVMFLAVYVSLRKVHQSRMVLALIAGWMGIAVYFSTNMAFSLLGLSGQYASAASETERSLLLAAGQALLAMNRFSSAAAPASGGYLSLLLVALGGMLFSIAMRRSQPFGKTAAAIGILANALDLAYCLAYPFMSPSGARLLAVACIPAAGLFLMLWHVLIGWRLLRLAGSAVRSGGVGEMSIESS